MKIVAIVLAALTVTALALSRTVPGRHGIFLVAVRANLMPLYFATPILVILGAAPRRSRRDRPGLAMACGLAFLWLTLTFSVLVIRW